MKRILPVFFALVVGASAWGADRDVLTPEPHRITDEAIAADIKVIQGLQGRLTALNNRGVPIATYHFAKAQAWLDFALDEYTINDRSRVVEETLHQALGLIEQLEAGKHDIVMTTPVIPTSEIVRKDLWAKAEDLKKRIDSRCTGDKIAQLEVQLVWAGHEEKEFDWRHAKPYLQAAERLAREADEQMAPCPPLKHGPSTTRNEPAAIKIGSASAKAEPTAGKNESMETRINPLPQKVEPAAAAKVEPAGTAPTTPGSPVALLMPAPAQCPEIKCTEPITAAMIKAVEPLPDRVHFAFDSAGISAASAAVIDRIAAAMKAEQTLRVVLYGHADQRGSSYYNMALSRQRADNVRARLVSAGIPTERISVAPFGKLRPLLRESSIEAYARNRRVEFFFTLGPPQPLVKQLDDLQPEKPAGKQPIRAARDGS